MCAGSKPNMDKSRIIHFGDLRHAGRSHDTAITKFHSKFIFPKLEICFNNENFERYYLADLGFPATENIQETLSM